MAHRREGHARDGVLAHTRLRLAHVAGSRRPFLRRPNGVPLRGRVVPNRGAIPFPSPYRTPASGAAAAATAAATDAVGNAAIRPAGVATRFEADVAAVGDSGAMSARRLVRVALQRAAGLCVGYLQHRARRRGSVGVGRTPWRRRRAGAQGCGRQLGIDRRRRQPVVALQCLPLRGTRWRGGDRQSAQAAWGSGRAPMRCVHPRRRCVLSARMCPSVVEVKLESVRQLRVGPAAPQRWRLLLRLQMLRGLLVQRLRLLPSQRGTLGMAIRSGRQVVVRQARPRRALSEREAATSSERGDHHTHQVYEFPNACCSAKASSNLRLVPSSDEKIVPLC